MQIIRMSMKNTLLIISCVLINEIESTNEYRKQSWNNFPRPLKFRRYFTKGKKVEKKKIVQVFNLDNLIGNFV